ncbi:DNA polymerase III subunit gamma/tau [Altererythrobacter sp. Root672]|uniref:DNA polymerase III subunit gamma/tau n=1 Tax=Altererythrobacter sp. Root672 TaxID=1736584 RepID=UPI0006F5DF59|nr:DNA polymerase III subunit gamma/tau [Altererythrobacter sp. Root672]KRA83703.1 DNA polymerase III subunit gamma/tau [Altererythrobacter sp. Root672]
MSDRPEVPDEEEFLETPPSAAELEAAGQSSMFGAPADPPAAPPPPPAPPPQAPASTVEAAQPYRVLARKYRPQTFSELIGQEPMVRTLANAIERDRLAHAFLMTGVRGVGKTSTARLIAKALNCVGPDGQGGPTIDPCGKCEPCVAIAEGRHIDVIEMDAASHTGVDDVREIIEAVRYAAVSARYKIYIIDEVHMLSRNAFNALLKTLEEPPAHVKFLFATTEVDKLPVTVLSRTQRFDLRRIPTPMLQQHFASICRQEGVEAEAEALHMIASAAEGSVRDGLSILDQAIAHADLDTDGKVTAERVRDMLGLADKSARRRLFGALLEGDPQTMLAEVDRQYSLGVEPLALLRTLMDVVHRVAVTQVGGAGADAPTQEERQAIEEWADRLSAGQVHRLWQLLLKGHDEVRGAPDPLVSAQMALLRVLHAADMPDPGTLAKQLGELAASGVGTGGNGGSAPGTAPVAKVDWAELCETVDRAGMLRVAGVMRDWIRVIELAPGQLTFAPAPGFSDDPSPELRDALLKATGQRWLVERVEGEGTPTLREQAEAAKATEAERIRNTPLVEAAFAAFPDAEIVEEAEASGRAGGPGGEKNWSRA